MDARYHELAETTGREKSRKRSAGVEAWVLLFLSVFFVNYVSLTAVGWLVLNGRLTGNHLYYFVGLVVLVRFCPSWSAIIHYRVRKLWPIRCTVFFAALSGTALAVSPVYRDFLNIPEAQETFFIGTVVFVVLVVVVMEAEYSTMRARYAYSERTGQWLHCYATRKRLVADPEKPPPETFAEVLALETAKKRFGVPHLALFLDSEPGGTHYLCAILRLKKQKFFSLKFSQPKFTSIVLPVDCHQVEQLHDRFGEFKKTFTIPLISVAVGDAIRKQEKQG